MSEGNNAKTRMELYIIEEYRDVYPDLSGKALTNALVKGVLTEIEGSTEAVQRLVIRRLPEGKPELYRKTPEGVMPGEWIFSVSHTENVFGCVIAPARGKNYGRASIGLDLQYRRPLRTEQLAKRVFTEEEIRYLREDESGISNSPAEMEHRFFRLWTRKEALAKYTGKGMSALLVKEPVLGREDVRFHDFVLPDGLYGCVCIGSAYME